MSFSTWLGQLSKVVSKPVRRRRPPRRRTRVIGCKPGVECLEDRMVPATLRFINPAGGDWDTPTNWDEGRIPGMNDDVVIDLPGIAVTHSRNVIDLVQSVTNQGATIDLA